MLGQISYQMIVKADHIFVVHRGVSQGGQKLKPVQRLNFWQKNSREINGLEIKRRNKIYQLEISMEALAQMKQQKLVIVARPQSPVIITQRQEKSIDKREKLDGTCSNGHVLERKTYELRKVDQ